MPIDRVLWTKTFTQSDPPNWQCPTCGIGSLAVVEGSLHIEETRSSLDDRDHLAWEPDWIRQRFVALLRCSRRQCADVVAVAGDTVSEEYYEPDPSNPYSYIDHGIETRLRAKYVSPAPALFRLPPATPQTVREEIISAFGLFWTDHGACANKLRSALEALMDHFRVKRWGKDKKTGKRRRLDLHIRIELLRKRSPEVIDHLLAAKWIGNAGVHSGSVTVSDIFDALDLIEYALDELIGKRSADLKRMAKTITSRKRPRSS